jgi:ATP-dependent Clp protease protease subunit
MSLRNLPKARQFERPQNFQWDPPSDVLAQWAALAPMAATDDETTITMFDVIGEDWWTGAGVTAKRVSAALRAIGDRDVTVKINSPGGDLFEGIAIYNLLAQHPAKVTVQVMGWAASAASIIAMAGDEIVMGLGTFMMVHNAWGLVVGNRHDLAEASGLFAEFDGAIADIYQARTGLDRAEIEKLMDADTFMKPSTAVEKGFADRVDEGIEAPKEDASASSARDVHALRRVDAALAQTGMPRTERRSLLGEIKGGTRDAAPTATQDAGEDVIRALKGLIETIKH